MGILLHVLLHKTPFLKDGHTKDAMPSYHARQIGQSCHDIMPLCLMWCRALQKTQPLYLNSKKPLPSGLDCFDEPPQGGQTNASFSADSPTPSSKSFASKPSADLRKCNHLQAPTLIQSRNLVPQTSRAQGVPAFHIYLDY